AKAYVGQRGKDVRQTHKLSKGTPVCRRFQGCAAHRFGTRSIRYIVGRHESTSIQEPRNAAKCSLGSIIRIINVRIKFDRYPVIVANLLDSVQRCGEVDDAFTGNEMMMHARGGDVLQMEMTNVGCQS